MRNLTPMIVIAAACILLAPPAVACRFWALVGEGYPDDLIADHLTGGPTNLRNLSVVHTDGWGIGCFPVDGTGLPLNRPLVRRGGPPANHITFREFDVAAEELRAIAPRAAIAHVRKCTISHCGVPDPHPFQRDGILFAHNGRMSDSLMVDLLTADDPGFLEEHPPEYVDDYIDSELYFLYLMKSVHEHPDLSFTEALRVAVEDLAPLTDTRLNFVLTDGDTLFVLRHAPNDINDPVRYYPATGGPSPFWIVASQTLGSDPLHWMAIPPRTLAVFVPQEAPRFYAIAPDTVAAAGELPAAVGAGLPRPNPAGAAVRVPITIPRAGANVGYEIWDVRGRLVRRDGPRRREPGGGDLIWDTRDSSGQPVPSGSYYMMAFVDGAASRHRVSVIR